MPLYEIVLSYPHGDEIRLTDQPLAVGDTVEIDYVEWKVVLERDSGGAGVDARFVCEPARPDAVSTDPGRRFAGRARG